jgi:hypothetical protein
MQAAELCDLGWDQVEFDAAVLHVRRMKNGTPEHAPDQGRRIAGAAAVGTGTPGLAVHVCQ